MGLTNNLNFDESEGGVTTTSVVMSGDRTLTESDNNYQILDPNGADRDVTLPEAPADGTYFVVNNANAIATVAYALNFYVGADTAIFYSLNSGAQMTFIYANSEWTCFGNGTSVKRTGVDTFEGKGGVAIGDNAHAKASGNNTSVAIGRDTEGGNAGVSVGQGATSGNSSVAIGIGAASSTSGVSVGPYTKNGNENTSVGLRAGNNSYSRNVAVGRDAIPGQTAQSCLGVMARGSTRPGSFHKSVFGLQNTSSLTVANEENGWVATTTDGTATNMQLGANGSYRFTLVASSIVFFKFYITAKEDSTMDCKAWEVTGAIKRDASNNTSIIGSITKTVIAADTGASSWDVDVVADDTIEDLEVSVTGEASHTIKWSAVSFILDRR